MHSVDNHGNWLGPEQPLSVRQYSTLRYLGYGDDNIEGLDAEAAAYVMEYELGLWGYEP